MSAECLSNKRVIICHNWRTYPSVVTLERETAIYSCQLRVSSHAGPRLHGINRFIYNDCVAINSSVWWVSKNCSGMFCQCQRQEGWQQGEESWVLVSCFFLFPSSSLETLSVCPWSGYTPSSVSPLEGERCSSAFPGDGRSYSLN